MYAGKAVFRVVFGRPVSALRRGVRRVLVLRIEHGMDQRMRLQLVEHLARTPLRILKQFPQTALEVLRPPAQPPTRSPH